MAPEPALIRRTVLTPLAMNQGLVYEVEVTAPGTTEAAQAYSFVSCGADLLIGLAYGEVFPSKDRPTIKRGVKWLLEGTFGEGSQRAAVFLAQAMAVQYELVARREGNEESERSHRSFRELIQRVYPLNEQALHHQQQLAVEYRVMETHEVPHEVQVGVRMGTGYHMALMRDDFSDYDDVDEDERLVNIQKSYADGYLRSMANLYAIELTVGQEKMKRLEPKLLTPSDMSIERLEHQNIDAKVWKTVAEDWSKQVERVLAADQTEHRRL